MRKSALLMLFIMVIWFVISFVTNLIGPLIPTIINDFHLCDTDWLAVRLHDVGAIPIVREMGRINRTRLKVAIDRKALAR